MTDACEFLTTIFSGCDGLIEVRPIPPTLENPPRFFRTPETATRYVSSLDGTVNVFFGAATRIREHGSKDDVQEIPGLWADLDTPESVANLDAFALAPTVLVETSPGRRQAFWCFRQPLLVEHDGVIVTVECVLRGIAEALGADLACAEVARVLRVPGTTNVKRGAPCLLLHADGARYTLQDFIEKGYYQEVKAAGGDGCGLNHDENWVSAALRGVQQGQRNAMCARLAGYLIRRHPPDISLALLESFGRSCRPPLNPQEVTTVWESVRNTARPSNDGIRSNAVEPHGLRSDASTDRDLGAGKPERTASQAAILVGMADSAELFHDSDGRAYATLQVGDHLETWPIPGRSSLRWLAREYYNAIDKPPNSNALREAIGVLEARAQFDGIERPVFLRVAEFEDKVYLDLGNEKWEAVEIAPTGWRVVTTPPVRFRRPRGMAGLPRPVGGGGVETLRQFLNLPNDADFRLIATWALAALRPRGPYPVLTLYGGQGSGKSSAARVLRDLIDPNSTTLRAEPRELRDIMIAANNSWCLPFDNLSHLPPWLSDAICRLATGGGFSTRELYSDGDEVLIAAQRPVILNGIQEVGTRSDLIDRSLIVYLPELSDASRRPEGGFWADFREARPHLLGVLLDATVAALSGVDSIALTQTPRMADFAVWGAAGAAGFGWSSDTFLTDYGGNRADANDLALDASPVAAAVRELRDFEGTGSRLLEILNNRASDSVRRQPGWPKAANGLSAHLRRLAPNFRQVGIEVTFSRDRTTDRTRRVTIRSVGD